MTPDPGKPKPDRWFEEDQSEILRLRYRVEQALYSAHSEHQRVEIVRATGFGRMLINDGIVMLSERDERIYHEMIAHVPLFVLPRPERVLVIGGGDGGTAREVLRHASVKHCRLVEIDGKVIEACREHLPWTATALDDPRVEVSVEDGVDFVARTEERYDLVIVDSSDPLGPALPLFGAEFYGNVQRVLNQDGMVVSQAESPFYEPQAQRSLLRILEQRFERVGIYNYSNLTYPGGLWSFSIASRGGLCPSTDFQPKRVEDSGLVFHYYDAAIHLAAFALPAFQREALGDFLAPRCGNV